MRERFLREQRDLSDRITGASRLMERIFPSDHIIERAASIAIAARVDGHRADITLIKTATAMAALEGREVILPGDLDRCAALVLPHRMRRRPFEERQFDWTAIQRDMERIP